MDSPRSWGECSDEVREVVVWNQWYFWRLTRVFPVDVLLLWGEGFGTRTKTRGLGRLTRRQMAECEDHLKSFIQRLAAFAKFCTSCRLHVVAQQGCKPKAFDTALLSYLTSSSVFVSSSLTGGNSSIQTILW